MTEWVRDSFASDILLTVVAEQQDPMKKSAAYHMDWARRVTKAFQERHTADGPIGLGDLVLPAKIPVLWPLVVVDVQSNKTGVVDLDTGEPKYFGATYVTRLQGLSTKQPSRR